MMASPGSKPPQRKSGFDCKFIEHPPKEFQVECPICLEILRSPHQVSCCGYSFCRHCLERVKTSQKPCPTCKAEKFRVTSNKGLKRSLYALRVRCSHETDGCEWIGELGQFEKHLNSNPELNESLAEGCGYVQVKCPLCFVSLERRYLLQHIEQCPQRPFNCEYCQDYYSGYEDVINNHLPECNFYPVQCTSECGILVNRKDLDTHIASDCPLTVVDCYLSHNGCKHRLPRKDMSAHFRECNDAHSTLFETINKQLRVTELERDSDLKMLELNLSMSKAVVNSLKGDIAKLRDENQLLDTCLQSKSEELEHNHQDMQQKLKDAEDQLAVLEAENVQLKKQCQDVTHQLDEATTDKDTEYLIELTMSDYHKHKTSKNDLWYSPPFFTHLQGFKLCLRVDAKGIKPCQGTHMTVAVHLMKGEFDDSLSWPFQGHLEIQLLSQTEDILDCIHRVNFFQNASAKTSGRVLKGDKASMGLSVFDFIEHSKLETSYLKDDCLKFRVILVE